jgi:type I restriction enzyme S subunit
MTYDNWIKFKLGEVFKVKHGFAFKGEYFTDIVTDDILLTPGNFKIGGGFKSDKFKYYKGEYPKEYILKEGDVIVTMTDLSREGDTLGYSAKIPLSKGFRYLHNQRLGLLQFLSSEFDKDFIYWLLRTKEYQEFIVSSATGSTVKHTSPSRIEEYEFRCPSLPVQRRIAAILTALDDKIELNRRMNETLEGIAQALWGEWFGTFTIGEIELPEGWRWGTLGEIASFLSGFAFKSEDFVEDGDFQLITIKNVQDGQFITDSTDRLESIPQRMPKYCLLKDGDILLSLTGNVGRICFVFGDNFLLNQRVAKLEPIHPFSKSSLYFFFRQKSTKDNLISIAKGTAQMNLSPIESRNVEVLIPDENIILKYGNVTSALYEKMIQNQIQSRSLTMLRETLLPKLMRGEVMF